MRGWEQVRRRWYKFDSQQNDSILLKMEYIRRELYSYQDILEYVSIILVIIGGKLGVSMEHILTIFHADMELMGEYWKRVQFVIYCNKHEA